MLILFDHGTPKGLVRALAGHDIITAQSRGWDNVDNGALLNAAEEFGISFCSRPAEEFAISKILRDENSLLSF